MVYGPAGMLCKQPCLNSIEIAKKSALDLHMLCRQSWLNGYPIGVIVKKRLPFGSHFFTTSR
jgi:hypothetical protein